MPALPISTISKPGSPLIDAHCHLDFEVFDDDRDQVIRRASEQNITDIIIPGTQKKFWDRIKDICVTNRRLHACYGLHPYWLDSHDKVAIEELDRYIENNHPVAVGECGLDFRPQQADQSTQMLFFEAQLGIAIDHKLPVVIHSVKATETTIKTIKKFKGLRGMIHSFSGSLEQARQLIELDFFISIGGGVTYDNAKKMKVTARDIPLTSLVLETDAPDQPDQQHSDERNEPAYLANTLSTIAELRNISAEVIAEQTTRNVKALFNI